MKVELFPVLVAELTRLRLLELVEVQWPHFDVRRDVVRLRGDLLVACANWLELPHSRRHLRRLRNLMPIILFVRINLAQEILIGLRRVAHPLLGTPAVMPSASLFHLFHFRDVVLVRFDAAYLSGIPCSIVLQSVHLRILLDQTDVCAQLLHLLSLDEILAHEALLILHLELPAVETGAVRISWHVRRVLISAWRL